MLIVNNLSISFDDKPILNHISFTLKAGQIACLLGASGCGKTTILRCIAGFEKPNTGNITLQDRTLVDAQQFVPAHQRNIGMVFQDYALFPHLTVADNIGFGLGNLDKHAKNARIDEMLSLIDMADYKHRYPHELSGGQQQRVALVRALAPKPRLVLLDEPFSNLDVELRTTLSKEVRTLLKSQGVSAILVTHDQAEAFAMADVVGMIADGKMEQWASPEALYHTPCSQKVARFIGEGVLYPIIAKHDNIAECVIGKIALSAPINPEASQLLIRPHDVKIAKDGQGIAVTVLDKDFRGGYWLYTLSTHQGDLLLMQVSMAVNHQSHQVGDQLLVQIRRASTL